MGYRTLCLALLVFILASYPFNIRADEIKIGLAVPLTGPLESEGRNLKKAAEIAVQDINSSGGVLGRQLTLVVEDDCCSPEKAVQAANRLIHDKVVFVVGHLSSGQSIAASTLYLKKRVIQMSPAAKAPLFTERDYENVFRMSPRSDQEGIVAGEYIGRIDKRYPIAIYYEDTIYGENVARKAKEKASEQKANIKLFEKYDLGTRDVTHFVVKMKNAKIKVLYLIGTLDTSILIINQIRNFSLDTLVVINCVNDNLILQQLNLPSESGKILAISLPNFSKNRAAKSFVEKLAGEGIRANNLSLFTYASIQLFAAAAKRGGGSDYDQIIQQLKGNVPFDTVIGNVSFDSRGNAEGLIFVFYNLEDGNFAKMNTRPPPPPPPPPHN